MENDMEKARKNLETRCKMQKYLTDMYRRGTSLFVDGESVLPTQAVKMTVREDCTYMADYVLSASGKIEQIRFDKLDQM